MADMVCDTVNRSRDFSNIAISKCLEPYLEDLIIANYSGENLRIGNTDENDYLSLEGMTIGNSTSSTTNHTTYGYMNEKEATLIIKHFRNHLLSVLEGEDDSSEEELDANTRELCNLEFNLAFGGKILLHQTGLRLLTGHRYGLVGKNGAGKTTLMTSIQKGKLDGWPMHLRTVYVDSGSNVDPEWENMNVMKHLTDTGESQEVINDLIVGDLKFNVDMLVSFLDNSWLVYETSIVLSYCLIVLYFYYCRY